MNEHGEGKEQKVAVLELSPRIGQVDVEAGHQEDEERRRDNEGYNVLWRKQASSQGSGRLVDLAKKRH